MSPEARAEARRLADQDLKEMPLHELRTARHLTQQQLAMTLDMSQAAVSQLEQRTDIYLSTLENFVEAMGGRLEMYAVFPDGKVKLGLEREASQAFNWPPPSSAPPPAPESCSPTARDASNGSESRPASADRNNSGR
jgi:DNA-binding XRE family transcriptional regulator